MGNSYVIPCDGTSDLAYEGESREIVNPAWCTVTTVHTDVANEEMHLLRVFERGVAVVAAVHGPSGCGRGFDLRRRRWRRRGALRTFKAAAWAVIFLRRLELDPCTKRSYTFDAGVDPETIRYMDQDLPRSGGEALVQRHMGRIRAMLLRHLAEDPHLGYCQGMNFVAAVFAAAAGSQAEAYERFRAFIQRLRGLWLPNFPLLQVGTSKFMKAAEEFTWYRHLNAHAVEPSMFLPQALLAMFALWLPLPTVVECLAILEQKGLAGMLALTLAVLDHVGDSLLQQRSMEGLLAVLKNLKTRAPEPSVLSMAARETLPKVARLESELAVL